jgi:hypothetical protein
MPISKIKGNAIEDDAITSARLDDGTIVAVDLASEAVNTSKMSGLTSSSSGFIKADGDGTMSVATADLVDDTTPQLGGDLDGNGNTINLTSNTGSMGVPAGTTAQENTPSEAGHIRFDTDRGVLTYYDGTSWFKVSAQLAVLDSVSGTIYAGAASTLTLTGSGFLTDDITVNFTQSSDGIDSNVTVTASSDTSATVTVPSAVYNNVTGGNAVTIKLTNTDASESGGVNTTAVGLPTGGTITTQGDYRVHTFTSSGSFVVPTGFSGDISYVIVAGGGGAASRSNGGGGAGGVVQTLTSGAASLSAGTYSLVVGAGGAGGASGGNNSGNNGSNSTGFSQTAIGGGASLLRGQTANSGGSGGGCSGSTTGTGGAGTSGQGNDGGDVTGNWEPSGGGGGYSEAGQDSSDGTNAGDGGDGFDMTSYFGTSLGDSGWVAGGGGGGCAGSSSEVGGAASQGGGARGRNGSEGDNVAGIAGATNTGGGGGGPCGTGPGSSHLAGGSGGSGVIYVAYDTTAL